MFDEKNRNKVDKLKKLKLVMYLVFFGTCMTWGIPLELCRANLAAIIILSKFAARDIHY